MIQKSMYQYRSKLTIFEDEAFVFVAGDTFKYGFDKKSGLICRLEVLGDDFLHGMNSLIPDIYVSNARDPREASAFAFAAKYEDEAECDIISANPYEVHIRTHGIYHNDRGETFPVRYRITYEIQSDGTIFVIVDNKAYKSSSIRWLCISRGLLNPTLVKYFSHLADQSRVDTTENYIFRNLPETIAGGKTANETLFSGRLIPWFWLGNDRTGVEICVWDVTHHRYGATQIAGEMVDPLGEVGANISCVSVGSPTTRKEIGFDGAKDQKPDPAGGILWEIFSLRNLQTPVREEWEQVNYFALSVTPPRRYNPGFADLRVYWAGPRRYSTSYKYLSDDKIRNLSRMGYNLIIGGVNWRFGEYIPDNESEAKRVVSTCHKYGMRIIPCVSLMDLNEDTAIFEEHGPEWRIEPEVEYEYETLLMCPGAEGWREHWEQQIDRIAEDYEFDGIYLDFWYDKLACRNPRHGCQRRYMRPTFPWVRDMLKYAGTVFKAKEPRSIVIANTDLLPISMICSWLDVRSVGESQEIRHVDPMTGKAFYSSHRLGCNSLMWPSAAEVRRSSCDAKPKHKDSRSTNSASGVQSIDHHVISLSLLYMAPIVLSQERSQEEIDLTLPYWNVLRFFGIGEAKWYPGFVDDPKIKVATTSSPDLYVNIHRHDAPQIPPSPLEKGEYRELSSLRKGGNILLTLVNLSPDEVSASVSLINSAELGLQNDKKYLVYEPLARKFEAKLEGKEQWSCDGLRDISMTVPEHGSRLLYIREWTENPVLLFALGGDKVLEEQWDADTGTLQFQLAAPAGADVSLAVYSPVGKPERIVSAAKEIQFTWDEGQKLALFDIRTSDVTTAISVSLLSEK